MALLSALDLGGVLMAGCMVIVLAFHSRIDRAASACLRITPELLEANAEWRKTWGVSVMAIACITTYMKPEVDPVDVGFVLLCPWVLANSSKERHLKVGPLTIVVLYGWFAARWVYADPQPLLRLMTRNRFFYTAIALYLEVSIDRLPTILLHHLLLNLMLGSGQFLASHFIASLALLALFCLRRQHWFGFQAKEDRPPISSQASVLVELVLQSGDELCESSREMLRQVLQLLDQSDLESGQGRRGYQHPGPTEITQSKLGRGTGGVDIASHGGIGDMNCDGVDEQVEVDWSGLDMFFEEGKPELNPRPDPRPRDVATARKAMWDGVADGVMSTDWRLSLMEDLSNMSVDCMSLVDPRSGTLLWRNHQFDSLLLRVGDGDALKGQQALFDRFLQNLSLIHI
eukprot:TRINITY_DN3515_c0_g2_i6.p1 TRINITY_DN3515_c0_g2~~TRINITY_DN3515_c0_g2_i6.p1  ORF type:complete len:401 (+),score=94.46 TRINITY_DN3515_c0_g2_i6:202-1404(+)